MSRPLRPAVEDDPLTAESFWSRVRSTLRDPLYRCESAQHARRGVLGWLLALGTAAIWFGPALFMADGVTRSINDGSLEGMLLTPVDRRRLVWAKLLGGVRQMVLVPLVLLCAAVVVDLALLIVDWPFRYWALSPDLLALHLPVSLWVLGWYLFTVGQSVTTGAIGLYVGLRWPGRFRATVIGLFGCAVAIDLEAMGAYVVAFVIMLVRLPFTREFPTVWFLCAYLPLRVVAVNILLPWWLMRSAALRMDDWLAGKGGRRPSRAARLARLAGG